MSPPLQAYQQAHSTPGPLHVLSCHLEPGSLPHLFTRLFKRSLFRDTHPDHAVFKGRSSPVAWLSLPRRKITDVFIWRGVYKFTLFPVESELHNAEGLPVCLSLCPQHKQRSAQRAPQLMHMCESGFLEHVEVRVACQDILVSFCTHPVLPTPRGRGWGGGGARRGMG